MSNLSGESIITRHRRRTRFHGLGTRVDRPRIHIRNHFRRTRGMGANTTTVTDQSLLTSELSQVSHHRTCTNPTQNLEPNTPQHTKPGLKPPNPTPTRQPRTHQNRIGGFRLRGCADRRTRLGRFCFDFDRWRQSRRSGDRSHSPEFGRSRRSAPIRAASKRPSGLTPHTVVAERGRGPSGP